MKVAKISQNNNYTWVFPFIDSPIDSIVEVGSRDALDAIELSKHFNAEVSTFEPDPESYKTCMNNLTESGHLPIKLYSEALSDTNGILPFNVYSTGNSSLFYHKTAPVRSTINVKVSRFDSLGVPAPDLLVMDAQSCEYQILKGFGQALSKTRYIVFETGFYSIYDSNENFDACNKYLKLLGYRLLATNVSGKGLLRFYIMRARGVIFYMRKFGFKGFSEYSGFFDVLFVKD
jgi:FkbM family methyltransferase